MKGFTPVEPYRTTRYLSVALVIVLFCLPACRQQAKGPGPGGPPPAEVSVMVVTSKSIPVTYEATGQTAGSREIEVRAQVTGMLLKRTYAEGDVVQRGTKLFQIDPASFEATVDQATAQVAQWQASVDKAKRDMARLKPLYEENAVSRKDLDDALAAEEQARAALQSAQATLHQARLNLGYTKVEAPISGVTSKASKSEGSLVTAGSDSLLTKIAQIDPIYVNFSFSDNEYLKMRKQVEAKTLVMPPDDKATVELTLADGSRFARLGKVTFQDTRVDPQTGTIQVRAEFPNPRGELVPNQFVRIALKGAVRPRAVLLPQKAVFLRPEGHFVYVVTSEGKAEERRVEAGEWIGDDWLISGGLKAGDQVIVDGTFKVRPGAPVRIAPATSKAASPVDKR